MSGLGTAILARSNTHIQKGEKQFNNEKIALGHLRIDSGQTKSIILSTIHT